MWAWFHSVISQSWQACIQSCTFRHAFKAVRSGLPSKLYVQMFRYWFKVPFFLNAYIVLYFVVDTISTRPLKLSRNFKCGQTSNFKVLIIQRVQYSFGEDRKCHIITRIWINIEFVYTWCVECHMPFHPFLGSFTGLLLETEWSFCLECCGNAKINITDFRNISIQSFCFSCWTWGNFISFFPIFAISL